MRGRKGERERERERENEGQVKFRADFLPVVSHCRKAKLLPDLGIHPCIVQCSYPSHLLVVIPLSSHSFSHLYFGFIMLLIFSHSLSLFWLSGDRSCCVAWHRVTMSVGKQSLSRIPLSLWQSSSPIKPYQ